MSDKKILFVITKSNWGGAQSYVYILATAFAKRGVEVVVVLGGTGESGGTPGLLAERLEEDGIRTIFVHNFMRDIDPQREGGVLKELITIFREERPQVVHLNSSKAGGLGALAARIAGIPKIVFTSHGLAYDEDRSGMSRALIWVSTWLTFLLVDIGITISSDTYRRARRLPFCGKKIRLVYNGLPETRLRTRREARSELILSEDQDSARIWIGTIAELTHNKGLTYLIHAAALLKKAGYLFELCIIGTGEDSIELQELAEHMGVSDCVHFLGFVPQASTYLTAFDIFTLTSVKEGLPYVLLEAGTAGCAVVGSRIPGISDVIDEDTGLLVPPRQPSEIAQALQILMDDPVRRKRYGDALKEKVGEKFSVDRMLDEIQDLYGF